jgi:hypothetical protein
MTPDDANTLTMALIERAWRAALEAMASEESNFWARTMAKHGVQQVRFSAHLPDDQHAYVMATISWLN